MVLKKAGVRRLAFAQSASQVADWAGRLAMAILVFDRLNLAWAVGVVGSMFFVAWLGPGQRLASMLSSLGSRGSMVSVETVRCAVFLAIAFPGIPLNAWTLGIVVLIASFADPVFEINRAALAVEVAAEDYGPAVKLLAAVNQIAQLVGYAAGGLLLAVSSERVAFLAIGFLFGLSGLALSQIEVERRSVDGEVEGSLSAARKFFAADRLSLVAMLAALGVIGSAMVVEAVAAVYGAELGLSESGVGLVAAALPAATFVGVAGLKTKATPVKILGWSLAVVVASSVVALVLFSGGGSLWAAVGAYAAIGFALVLSIAGNVVVGSRIPAENRAPVFGVVQGVLYSTMAAAAAAGGFVAQFAGARSTNIAAALLMLGAGVAGLLYLRFGAIDEDELAPL